MWKSLLNLGGRVSKVTQLKLDTKSHHRADEARQGIPGECSGWKNWVWERSHNDTRSAGNIVSSEVLWKLIWKSNEGKVCILRESAVSNLGDFFTRKLLLEVSTNVLQGGMLCARESSIFNKMFLDVPNLSRPGFLEVIVFPRWFWSSPKMTARGKIIYAENFVWKFLMTISLSNCLFGIHKSK